MDKQMEEIINRIRNERQKLGYSYQDLADKTGMSRSTLQRYESGKIYRLPVDKFMVLAEALHCSPAFLMGLEDTTNYEDISCRDPIADNELSLIENYRLLNEEGQEKAVEYIDDLCASGKYKKRGEAELDNKSSDKSIG